MSIGFLLWGESGGGVALFTYPHLVPRLKNKYSYTSTPLLGLCSPFQGNVYLYLYLGQEFVLTVATAVMLLKFLDTKHLQRNLVCSRHNISTIISLTNAITTPEITPTVEDLELSAGNWFVK
jgi:hypothetical protein